MDKVIPLLSTKKNKIITSEAKEITLKGINLGGWLMLEGYILFGKNIPAHAFKQGMQKAWGIQGLEKFLEEFRSSFITESDFKNLKDNGFNCIRLPFNYKLLEEKQGIGYLDRAIQMCEKYSIYCILDMHAAPGCQNSDWHGDSSGESHLWQDEANQERFFSLWERLADRYKDKSIIAGYDLLNEPVIDGDSRKVLRPFYKEAVERIRKIDKYHIIFLEGNTWSQDLEDIGKPFADNLCYSVHYYHPLDLTHNFNSHNKYPGNIQGEKWDKGKIREILGSFHEFSNKHEVPILVGEFGINCSHTKDSGCLVWLDDTMHIIKEFGFHWTYWTYKTILNPSFPDGLYKFHKDIPWINRKGPVSGWENLYILWKDNRFDILDSLKTANFEIDLPLVNLLAKYI